jgi:LEA14-like dessication related protein
MSPFVIRLALLLMIFTGWSCAPALVKPDLTLESVELAGVSFSAVDLAFKIKVANPNPVGVHIEELSYSLVLNKIPLGSGQLTRPVYLNALESQTVTLPFSASMKGISGAIKFLLGDTESEYELTGKMILSKFLAKKEFSFSTAGVVPIDRSAFHH